MWRRQVEATEALWCWPVVLGHFYILGDLEHLLRRCRCLEAGRGAAGDSEPGRAGVDARTQSQGGIWRVLITLLQRVATWLSLCLSISLSPPPRSVVFEHFV